MKNLESIHESGSTDNTPFIPNEQKHKQRSAGDSITGKEKAYPLENL